MALNTPQTTQATASSLQFILLVDLVFTTGAIYVTDLDRAITVGGTVYTPAAVLMGLSGVEDNLDGKARSITVSLAGNDATLRSRVLANRIAFGDCLVRMAFCDTAWTIIDTPIVLSRSQLSNASANYDEGSGLIEINAESSSILFSRNARQLVSNQSQLLRFPGDTACSRVSDLANKKINWGGAGARVKPGGRPPYGIHTGKLQ